MKGSAVVININDRTNQFPSDYANHRLVWQNQNKYSYIFIL